MLILEATGVSKKFSNKFVLNNLNLKVCHGDFFGFLGTNGAGKTTFFRILSGVLRYDSGQIELFSKSLNDNLEFIKNKIGYVPDCVDLIVGLTGNELLAVTAAIKKYNYQDVYKKVESLCNLLNFRKEDLNKRVENYSRGMKQKLLIINSLLYEPELLVLDEPFSGLDAQTTFSLREFLKELNTKKKITIFMTEHRLDLAEYLCNKISVLDRGKIIFNDATEKLKITNNDLYDSFINIVRRSDQYDK